MLNTVVRQIAFYRFETLLHDERRKGELAHERIGELWMQVQTESLGPAFDFTPDYGVYWAYIPHFVHTPFYVYAYAFGDCLVNALYGVFRDGASGLPGEVPGDAEGRRHASGTRSCWRPSGWTPPIPPSGSKGLDVISGFIDELEHRGMSRCPKPSSTLFGEMRRMVRTSGAVGGIAARVAGERFLGIKTDKTAHAEDLKQILGGLKGPLMKVAQFLSTVPDALPEEYAQELATLQANAPPMGWAFVRRRMQSRARPRLAVALREASARRRPPRRASARCTARRCMTAARSPASCNIPDMPSVVEADLRQLKLAMPLYRRMDSTLDNEEAYNELARPAARGAGLRARGGAHAALRHDAARTRRVSRCPTPVPELTTKRLLTMTWLEGRPILRRLEEDPPEEERNAYAKALFRAWYVPFYRYGVIHGDPHLGNYQVRDDADEVRFGINLFDFGAIRVFPASFVTGVVMLYEAVRDDDEEKAAEAYRIWGFRNLSQGDDGGAEPLGAVPLRAAGRGPGAPHQQLDDPMLRPADRRQVHEGLKRTGGVKIPREFPLMDRAAIGLGSVFFRLRAEANWHRLFMELVQTSGGGGGGPAAGGAGRGEGAGDRRDARRYPATRRAVIRSTGAAA